MPLFQTTDYFVVQREGRPYQFTALIVRAIEVMSKWIIPLLRGVSSEQRLEEELKKTEVLCANCHRRLTAKARGWFRGRK
jgi:hypothetical protein